MANFGHVSPKSKRAEQQRAIVKEIEAIHSDRDMKSYGSPRIHRELIARGHEVCENTVAKLMSEYGIHAAGSRKFRVTTDSNHSLPIAENTLNRSFDQAEANRVWLADITYVWTQEGWLYLACVLDVYSRIIVGWSMKPRMTTDLVSDALTMALGRRGVNCDGLMHHSDRGSQYASHAFQELLAEHNIECSMSRKGDCWDNAMMESFFATLKKELVHQNRYATRDEAIASIFDYIERFYNRIRRHSALGYISPEEYERAA